MEDTMTTKQGSNHHPAATRDSRRPPVDGEDGISHSGYEQRKKLFEERDQPDATKRK
jgi:hypothetical protein